MDLALSNLQNAQGNLIKAALTPEEVALKCGADLKKHGADLLQALKNGDQRRANIALENVKRDLNNQANALRSLPGKILFLLFFIFIFIFLYFIFLS